MSARITFVELEECKVYHGGLRVGTIRKGADGQFRYFPKGSKTSGEPFGSLRACQRSLTEG
jgi:hypothetical protein